MDYSLTIDENCKLRPKRGPYEMSQDFLTPVQVEDLGNLLPLYDFSSLKSPIYNVRLSAQVDQQFSLNLS